jgi:hypothetical protein
MPSSPLWEDFLNVLDMRFSQIRLWIWLSSEMWRRVICQKFTDVSDELTALSMRSKLTKGPARWRRKGQKATHRKLSWDTGLNYGPFEGQDCLLCLIFHFLTVFRDPCVNRLFYAQPHSVCLRLYLSLLNTVNMHATYPRFWVNSWMWSSWWDESWQGKRQIQRTKLLIT